MKALLVLALVSLGSVAAYADATPAPTPDVCADLVKGFKANYTNLYNVDTRPLAIDQYKVYRDTIESLRQNTEALVTLCNGRTAGPGTPSNLYKSKEVSWKGAASYTNDCTLDSVDYKSTNAEFEETSIRECYRDGYATCTVKENARFFNIKGSQNGDMTWACTATVDTVIAAAH